MRNLKGINVFLKESEGEKFLTKEFDFENFSESIDFVNKIAGISEEMDHHPKIIIDYNKVTVESFTHDEGRVTGKDYELMKRISSKT
jgi:4a-hydroxytetrahydrobiopterin dehydratase